MGSDYLLILTTFFVIIGGVLTTMTFALYPTRVQAARLIHFLRAGRLTYNRALEARKHWYAATGKALSCYEQHKDLTELRAADPFWADIPVWILRDGVCRVDRAFKAFFRRLKERKKKPGFPRFKSARRWNSFSISNPGQILKGNRVHVTGVGSHIRARNVRPLNGKAKALRIVLRSGRWFAQAVVEDGRATPPAIPVKSAVGIDLGLNCFAALSDGKRVENPHFGRIVARKLRSAHRSVSRKQKGSHRRRKAIRKFQRVYARISNLRQNFLHHASKKIVAEHQLIVVEDLKVINLARGRLARSILDACWGQFLWYLTYKAARAGGQVVRVNPAGTSQECSRCGGTVQKDLSVRVHACPCGLVLDRDENAARVILARALKWSGRQAGSAPPSDSDGVTLVEGSASTVGAASTASRPGETSRPKPVLQH